MRLYRLDGRSLWLDEIITAYAVRLPSLSAVLAYVHFWFDNMPPIFVLLWLVRGLGGSEIAVRLPFVVAGALTIPALYLLGKTLARPRLGLLAAGLMAVLPFAVWYSQEARQYAFLLLFTTLQMLFAYRAAGEGRRRDWGGLVAASVANLYLGYLAVAVTAAALTFAGLWGLLALAVAWRARRAGAAPGALRSAVGKLAGVVAAGAAVGLAYLPWLPQLRDYLSRQNWSYTGLPTSYDARWADLPVALGTLDFSGLLLAAVGLGVLTLGGWAWRGRWGPGLLLGCWLGVPLAAFWIKLQGVTVILPARYFCCLYPALVLLAACGVEGLAQAGRRGIATLRRGPREPGAGGSGTAPRRGAVLAFTLGTLLLLAQALPALAQSYQAPKYDYRGATAYISAHSPPGSVVFTLRQGTAVFISDSLNYYFWLQHAPVVAVDAGQLDYQAASRIAQGAGVVWAFSFTPFSPEEEAQARAAGLEPHSFVGFTVLRTTRADLPPLQQAQALLAWDSAAEPRLQTAATLLRAAASPAPPGANLLPPPGSAAPGTPGVVDFGVPAHWVLGPGAALTADRRAFHLVTHEQEINVVLATNQVTAGQTYLLQFRYRNAGLDGAQRVYAVAHAADMTWLDIFPGGLGYLCPAAADWTAQGFAFTLPPAATAITLWLRATGTGAAEFTDVALRPLPAAP